MYNQRLLRKTKQNSNRKAARAKKRKSIKRLTTDEEKAAAKAKVDEAVNNAKESIDQATNNDGCRHCENKLDSINNIQPTVVKKDEAKQRLIKRRKLKSRNRPNTKCDR